MHVGIEYHIYTIYKYHGGLWLVRVSHHVGDSCAWVGIGRLTVDLKY